MGISGGGGEREKGKQLISFSAFSAKKTFDFAVTSSTKDGVANSGCRAKSVTKRPSVNLTHPRRKNCKHVETTSI